MDSVMTTLSWDGALGMMVVSVLKHDLLRIHYTTSYSQHSCLMLVVIAVARSQIRAK